MKKPRILLADDHRIVLEGLRGLLEGHFELAGTATNGRELLDLARQLHPDVIVADITMPLLNGIEAARMLRDEGNPAKIVFLTMHPDAIYASRALEAGASAYVLKHSASDELVAAIHEVLRGATFLSATLQTPAMAEQLDSTRRRVKQALALTSRQREVLQLLAEGKSAKQIGAILDISARTVETHKYKMMDELGVKTSAELVQQAIKLGLVTP
jgi:RNA polymerase sigma factor (sigma-70 family)